MRNDYLWLGAILALCASCAQGETSAEYNSDQSPRGGQTGSLRPCEVPAEARTSVPAGDVAVLFHSGCAEAESFMVVDANGDPVTFHVETVDDGVLLLRTDDALVPGLYTVTTPNGSQETVTVAPAAPLPTALGSLELAQGSCSDVIRLRPQSDLLPYLQLLKLEYSIDAGPRQPWFEYGTVALDGGFAYLKTGVDSGRHELTVYGSLAGEDAELEPVSLSFTTTCTRDANDCSIAPAGADAGAASLGWFCAAFFMWLTGWRRRALRRQVRGPASAGPAAAAKPQ